MASGLFRVVAGVTRNMVIANTCGAFVLLMTLTLGGFIISRVALATEFMVGDGSGWTVGFDYAAWAKDKEFYVGDKLVFTYPVGKHNVFKVNGTTFNDCAIPPSNEALSTGNGVITLATPGRKWYFCGVAAHCKGGQKLAITVWPAMVAPAPAPNSAIGITSSRINVLFTIMISLAVIFIA